tara:strand:- start:165 stop:680 length:516 start_codon:yes stop_codon:yes gene_type:complete
MLSFYHSNKNKLYIKLVEFSRNIFFYKKIGLKDSFETRLILVFFHFSIILLINKRKFKNKKDVQKIFDNIFLNIEYDLREKGHGDVAVNKKMKDFNKIFYDILLKIDKSKDNKFQANIDLFSKHSSNFDNMNINLEELQHYFNSFYNFCLELDIKDLINGNINFGDKNGRT